MNRLTRLLLIISLGLIGLACHPEHPRPGVPSGGNVVILARADTWSGKEELRSLHDSLSQAGHRVMVSGEADETAVDLAGRLPWLLQPGVQTFYYDPDLAGGAGLDSLRAVLIRLGHPAELKVLGDSSV